MLLGLGNFPCATTFVRSIAVPSHMDENSWRWKDSEGKLLALCTCHVDDVAIAGPKKWLEHHYQAFVKKFKKVTRQQLPFEHCGARYERIGDGYRMNQAEFCSKMKAVDIENQRKDNDKLLPEEVTQYRSILGALLWLTRDAAGFNLRGLAVSFFCDNSRDQAFEVGQSVAETSST